MDSAALVGVAEDDFWNLTPREFSRLEWAHVEKLKIRHKENVTIAWHTAAFMRQRRLGSLNTFLSTAKRLSAEEKKAYQEDHERLVKAMGG